MHCYGTRRKEGNKTNSAHTPALLLVKKGQIDSLARGLRHPRMGTPRRVFWGGDFFLRHLSTSRLSFICKMQGLPPEVSCAKNYFSCQNLFLAVPETICCGTFKV